MSRLVSNFSCGAASAVATKIVIAEQPDREMLILNAYIEEEHPDNQRFLEDCQRWFGRPRLDIAERTLRAVVRSLPDGNG